MCSHDAQCNMLSATVPCLAAVEKFCANFTTPAVCCRYQFISKQCCPDRDPDIDVHHFNYTEHNLAYFSSLGPADDGRIKPDVVCPGHYTWSAKSHADGIPNECGTDTNKADAAIASKSGTSMATPTCAGNTALLREYLQKGFIANGVQDNGYGLQNIPASLLKALVINSADSLSGNFKEYAFSGGPYRYLHFSSLTVPNMYEGYGRMKLDDAVPHMNDMPQYQVLIARDSKSPCTDINRTVISTLMAEGENSMAMCFTVVSIIVCI